jgi:hypothetical protein
MKGARRISVSAAAFVLICFFLPWIELSCAGIRDSASGYDLARSGDRFLWLLPVFMLAIIILGLMRFIWDRVPAIFALVSMVGGALSAYLMYREYSSTKESTIPVAAQWTAWFWLSFAASIGIAVAAFMFYSKRSRSP